MYRCHFEIETDCNTKFKMTMKIKEIGFVFLAAMLFTACSNNDNPQWEYIVLPVKGSKVSTPHIIGEEARYEAQSVFKTLCFPESTTLETTLSLYGKDGWELVSTYTTTETVFPNFGNEDYHTGIKENTRTETVNFVFKRRVKKQSSEPKVITNANVANPDSVVVAEEARFIDTSTVVEESAY